MTLKEPGSGFATGRRLAADGRLATGRRLATDGRLATTTSRQTLAT